MHRPSPLNRVLLALAVGAAAIGSSAAQAQNFERYPQDPISPPSQLTRAEVLADLQIYRESGLAQAARIDEHLGGDSAEVLAARQRYAQLRNSERYAALVAQIAQQTGEPVHHQGSK